MPLGVSALLSATATGILVFLLWDVLSAGIEPVEGALHAAALDHDGTWLHFVGLAAVFATCFGVGLMSLVYFDGIVAGRRRRGGFRSVGAAAVAETDIRPGALSPAQSLSLLIATGIGLHNFSEGLAIGQSAASGELSLALVLVIGFGLHNATEGFGIVGPFSGGEERPSWGFLGLVGLSAAAPTFFGTLLGQTWVSEPSRLPSWRSPPARSCTSWSSCSASAGAWPQDDRRLGAAARRHAGFATDFVLVAAGA